MKKVTFPVIAMAAMSFWMTVVTFAQAPATLAPATPPPASAAPVNDLVQIVTTLGPLANDLVAALSMDGPDNGSIIFSRPTPPLMATFFGNKQFVQDDGRQCAKFAEPSTFISLFGNLDLGRSYTLATWMKFPTPGNNAAVWDGTGRNTPLYVLADKFMCTASGTDQTFCMYDKSLTGWHHVAVTCDGAKMTFFLDGAAKGSAPVVIPGRIRQIGSRTFPIPGVNSQCDLLDDMFLFSRALGEADMPQLVAARLTTPAPSPAGVAATAPAPGSAPSALTMPQAPAAPAGTALNAPSSMAFPGGIVSPASTDAAAELVKTYRNSLVFVTSGRGAGSGWIADFGGKTFLVTNAHVAAGAQGAVFKTLDGVAVPAGAPAVAAGHDIFVMGATAPSVPFEIMRGVDQNAAIGDEVVVLGNAEGGGVINTIMGKIVGLGPNLVEVDAPFQPGNSGSPIIHLKSKKVVGVATYLTFRKYDPATRQPIKDPVIRRFGYRIDSVKTWQPVNWPAFYAQAAEMAKIEKLTEDFTIFIKDIADDSRVSRGKHENPAIRTRIDAWLASKANRQMSSKDAATVNQNFISFLKITSQSDIAAARQRLTYDYFQRDLEEQQKERAAISEIFEKIIKELQQER